MCRATRGAGGGFQWMPEKAGEKTRRQGKGGKEQNQTIFMTTKKWQSGRLLICSVTSKPRLSELLIHGSLRTGTPLAGITAARIQMPSNEETADGALVRHPWARGSGSGEERWTCTLYSILKHRRRKLQPSRMEYFGRYIHLFLLPHCSTGRSKSSSEAETKAMKDNRSQAGDA